MSCAVIRTRFPTLRTLPSSTELTPSFSPISRMSTSFPLKVKEEVREATWMPGTLASALMISSVMPSLKYSFSGSALRLASGSTAMALRAGEAGGVRTATVPCPDEPMPFSWRRASTNAPAVAKRSTGVLASARDSTSSTASGTSRVIRTLGTGETNRLAITACAVAPVKGGSPVSISYSTQPRL